MKPISLTLDGCIQRIYGSDIAVPLKLVFQLEDTTLTVSGVGFCKDVNEINLAWNAAVKMCFQNADLLCKKKPINILDILITVSKEEANILNRLKEKYMDPDELNLRMKEIFGQATKAQQIELDMLCEQLGIEHIKVEEDPDWSMIKVHALITELKKKVKIYEVDVDKQILFESKK